VMNPPTPDESHWTTINQMPATMENVAVDTPAFGQGEIEAKPRPRPSATRITDEDAAATAPPRIAFHEIAETEDSAG
jgi:hypothetical protein